MEHVIVIWSKSKSGRGYFIEGRITLDEMQIADIGSQQWEANHDLNPDREYWGEIESTKYT